MPDPIQGVQASDPLRVASNDQAASSQAPVQAGESSSGVAVDSADVEWAQALLATITQAAAEVPPVDQTRVAELQQAINSGTYQANPQQIAEKIVEIEALLASRQKVS
jgi:negative regulator of flagellin synthesis FlgM